MQPNQRGSETQKNVSNELSCKGQRIDYFTKLMSQGPLIALSFLFIFEFFNAQKFGIKGVDKGQVTTIKRLRMKLTF